MENRAYALAAGLFVLILSVALIFVAFWFSGDNVARVQYRLISRTAISGLNEKAPVRWRGVDVGTVDSINFDPSDPHRLFIDISVDKTAPLPVGTFAQLGFLGITGLSFVQLDDAGIGSGHLASPGPIEVRPSLLDEVSVSGQQFVGDASQVLKRFNTLLSDQNLANMSQTLANLDVAAAHLADITKTLPATLQRADHTMAQLDPLLGNLNALSVDLQKRVGAVDQAGNGLEKLGDASAAIHTELLQTTLPKLHLLADQLGRDAQSLEQVLSDIHERPQSFVFGRSAPAPGPGEPGFTAPKESK